MPDYITTYGGTHFVPTEPEAEKIHISDIAHALSLICRGNGQVKTFFSVGQHCINCALEAEARGYSQRVILACLLHDAGEAYLSDVPSPFKKHLSGYKKLEECLLSLIYRKYLGSDLTEEEERQVEEIDKDMLWYDLWILLGEVSDRPKPVMKTTFSYEVQPFEKVEEAYRSLYEKWKISVRETG